jgi:isocitrate dehydrogenase
MEMAIRMKDGVLQVPPSVIIPYIEGDGVGEEITSVMKSVVEAAVKKAYGDTCLRRLSRLSSSTRWLSRDP